MYQVKIIKLFESEWKMMIVHDGKMLRTWNDRQLIELINTASVLGLHIDNIDELPLNQYANLF